MQIILKLKISSKENSFIMTRFASWGAEYERGHSPSGSLGLLFLGRNISSHGGTRDSVRKGQMMAREEM